MPKFAKQFLGAPEGEIYPIDYQPGEECPPSLLEAARALGVLEEVESGASEADDDGAAGYAEDNPRNKARKS